MLAGDNPFPKPGGKQTRGLRRIVAPLLAGREEYGLPMASSQSTTSVIFICRSRFTNTSPRPLAGVSTPPQRLPPGSES